MAPVWLRRTKSGVLPPTLKQSAARPDAELELLCISTATRYTVPAYTLSQPLILLFNARAVGERGEQLFELFPHCLFHGTDGDSIGAAGQ